MAHHGSAEGRTGLSTTRKWVPDDPHPCRPLVGVSLAAGREK